jgi:hypothetical protein
MLEIGLEIKLKVMVLIHGLMEIDMMVNGCNIRKMEEELISFQMVINM